MGHSGGAPHALACGALLGERVNGVAAGSGLAPRAASGLNWFAGMAAPGTAELRAAQAGRVALEDYISGAVFDPEVFTPADLAILQGEWAWLGMVAQRGMESGPAGMVDDDLGLRFPLGVRSGRCHGADLDRPRRAGPHRALLARRMVVRSHTVRRALAASRRRSRLGARERRGGARLAARKGSIRWGDDD